MKQNKLKIVVVGGGGFSWTPRLLRDMLLTPALCDAQYILLDIDQKLTDLSKAFLEKLAKRLKVGATFVSTTKRSDLADADYVVIAISTGGLDAMEHDIAIPEKFSVYHTVGDTSGPGGWARLIRNFKVFESLGQDINRYAPGAVVLNYTNPMTTLTDVLARICHGPVVGLCHALFGNLKFIKNFYGLDSEDEIAIQYAGINHFIWTTAAKAGGIDALADLRARVAQRSLTELAGDAASGDPEGHSSNHEVATELFRQTGVLPYIGDRHTSEFFSCYITSKTTMKQYKLARTPIAERRAGMVNRRRDLENLISGEIPDHFLKRSRETCADIINAHSQGEVFIDVGNVPNIGQISNLPRGLVVETAVRVDRNGFTPLTFGALPQVVQGFIEPYGHVFPMVVDACFSGDKLMALQALRLDPVCANLTGAAVRDLGEQLLAAHREFVPEFK